MRGIHWWTLIIGLVVGYAILPGAIAWGRARFGG
jgi:hypothetical protein